MRVRIYHSTERGFRFENWRREAPLKLVDDYVVQGWRIGEGPESRVAPGATRMGFSEGDPMEEILELISRDQQSVDGHERNVRMRNRSLSVGDVVMLDERAFTVASVGWREINPAEMATRYADL